MKLTKDAAFSLLTEGLSDPLSIGYVTHSKHVGDLACLIAGELGLDAERAAEGFYPELFGKKENLKNA
ncbi:MAG: hypothetical protein IJS65_08855 [Clostridia bacterium]|nr:hypothetical protein [Clostridia bacterium]